MTVAPFTTKARAMPLYSLYVTLAYLRGFKNATSEDPLSYAFKPHPYTVLIFRAKN